VLVDNQTLPQIGKAPYLAGWSLVMTYDSEGNSTGLVARHSTKVTVPISVSFSVDFEVSAVNSKMIRTDNTPPTGEFSSIETRSHTESFKAKASIGVPFDFDNSVQVSGLLTGGSKVTPKTEGAGIDKITTFVYSNTATKLDKAIGVSPFEDLIEGSISIASGVIVDMDVFNADL